MKETAEINRRIDALDYLRGFALLGIILVNILPLLDVKMPASSSSVDASYFRFLYLFVEGRFYTIFTFLFGVGFYIFITRALQKGFNGYLLFLRRAAALFVFGLVHVYFHPGEALTVYAICGVLLLPFYRMPRLLNLNAGLSMLLAFSFFSYKLIMVVPIMLLGIAAGQFRIFETYPKHLRKVLFFTIVMLVISLIGLYYQYQYAPFQFNDFSGENFRNFNRFIQLGIMVGPTVSAVYVGLLLMMLRVPILSRILSPLKNLGRMALTNYLAQTALILLSGKTFDLASRLTYVQSLFMCISFWGIQLIFSTVWIKFFHYGPMEWLWRMITYSKMLPLKKVKGRE